MRKITVTYAALLALALAGTAQAGSLLGVVGTPGSNSIVTVGSSGGGGTSVSVGNTANVTVGGSSNLASVGANIGGTTAGVTVGGDGSLATVNANVDGAASIDANVGGSSLASVNANVDGAASVNANVGDGTNLANIGANVLGNTVTAGVGDGSGATAINVCLNNTAIVTAAGCTNVGVSLTDPITGLPAVISGQPAKVRSLLRKVTDTADNALGNSLDALGDPQKSADTVGLASAGCVASGRWLNGLTHAHYSAQALGQLRSASEVQVAKGSLCGGQTAAAAGASIADPSIAQLQADVSVDPTAEAALHRVHETTNHVLGIAQAGPHDVVLYTY